VTARFAREHTTYTSHTTSTGVVLAYGYLVTLPLELPSPSKQSWKTFQQTTSIKLSQWKPGRIWKGRVRVWRRFIRVSIRMLCRLSFRGRKNTVSKFVLISIYPTLLPHRLPCIDCRYLVIFLKFMGSVIPTIEHDNTMGF